MKACIINETVVQNICSEINPSFIESKFMLDQNNIKTYTEQYINSFVDTSNNKLIEFYFININAQSCTNVEVFNYESKTVILKTYVRPIRSIILCLEEENLNNKFIITNLNDHAYKYKLFANESNIHVFNPRKGYQIEFDGHSFYAKLKRSKSDIPNYALIINVFNDLPNYANCLKMHSSTYSASYQRFRLCESMQIDPTIIENNFLTYDFFDNLLYKKQLSSVYLDVLALCNEPLVKIAKPIVKPIENISCKNDIKIIMDSSNNALGNRFLQRFTKNMYSPITCKWIIDEYVKLNVTPLSIEKMSNVFSYVLFSFKDIVDFFIKSYGVDSDIDISIASGTIVSYKCDTINNSIGMGVSCMLLLSTKVSIIFNDGLKYELTQGDLLLYKKQEFKVNCSDEVYIAFFDITVKCD